MCFTALPIAVGSLSDIMHAVHNSIESDENFFPKGQLKGLSSFPH